MKNSGDAFSLLPSGIEAAESSLREEVDGFVEWFACRSDSDWKEEVGVVNVEACESPESKGTSFPPCLLRATAPALSKTTPSSKEPYPEP